MQILFKIHRIVFLPWREEKDFDPSAVEVNKQELSFKLQGQQGLYKHLDA